jgi:ankyrin repeat protein
MKELATLMSDDVDVNLRGKFGQTPLHIAAKFDSENAVEKLLCRGRKLEATDNAQFTALHLASFYGSEISLKALLKHGANVKAKDSHGATPSMLKTKFCSGFRKAPDAYAKLDY